ncbi:1-aminocyclopropane-1-carboxylate synthase [Neofusicoccum parvum]|uniref:1-aminocyclopropane-1-carboxylate synthase n=1 Tax=Neofusicoccum parvum TaxID=310453 RepID=A0ACB5S524_9PEZI|nr:1-aminocyclopropane-1-carboxylate synthase [Neofusicoccum parvum]
MASQEHGGLSARGVMFLTDAGHRHFHDVLDDIYQPEHNPDGILSLGLAENSLMHNELLQYINDTFKMSSHYLMYGDGSSGSKRLRAAIAHFVNRHFNPVLPVESSHVHVTLGVSNANEMLAFVLGCPGDGFLLGRPYYGAFAGDFGRCYSRDVIIALMKLCQKHRIHLVSDEIYALSVWDNPEARDAPTFTSVLSIDTTGIIDPSLVHAMWGMSKDFGANGLRIGCIISQHNPTFRESLRQISLVNYPSGPADQIAAAILEDDAFTDAFVAANRARIAEGHAVAAAWLRRMRIPHAPAANAGFFLWVDLRAGLAGEGAGGAYDHELLKRLMGERRVSVSDALAFGGEEEGWFRIVFTHPRAFVEMGLQRLEGVLEAYRSAKA